MTGHALRRFAEETEPSLESVRSLRLRLEERPATRPSVAGPLTLGLALGAAAAAVALIVLIRAGEPPALDQALVAELEPQQVEPVLGVTLDFQGLGHLGGTADAPEIEWQAGTVEIEVQPAAGKALLVRTREGTVRVVGTRFDVTRDALGTRTRVTVGTVAVRCVGLDERDLTAGESHTCAPVTPAGMLARARALQGGAGSTDLILAAVARGLSMPGLQAAVQVELRIVEIEALRDVGRTPEALERAVSLRPEAGHRAQDVQELIEALQLELEPR